MGAAVNIFLKLHDLQMYMKRTVSLFFLGIGRTVQVIEQRSYHGTCGSGAARAPIVSANQEIRTRIALSDGEQRDRALWVLRERGEIISERVPFINEADLVTAAIRTSTYSPVCVVRR